MAREVAANVPISSPDIGTFVTTLHCSISWQLCSVQKLCIRKYGSLLLSVIDIIAHFSRFPAFFAHYTIFHPPTLVKGALILEKLGKSTSD